MYAGAPLSLGAFRLQVPDAVRPYRVPAAVVLSPLGFIIANMIIYWSGFVVVWKLGVCLVIGYVLIGIAMIFDRKRPPLDWKSAQWLLPYLIGMGIISWLGQFPLKGHGGAPPINTFHIPSWWDYLIVAAFSLVIYFWAVATRLPHEQMQERVARQAGQDDLPDRTTCRTPGCTTKPRCADQARVAPSRAGPPGYLLAPGRGEAALPVPSK